MSAMDKEDLHTLRLMEEIERDDSPSQRELSARMNLSLGLVNSFLKRLVNKGYFKVKTMPRNRVKYFFTPKGLARKSRLTVEYLRYSVDFYKSIKDLLLKKYHDLEEKQKRGVLFLGSGETAELAYLYLQLTKLKLVGVVDEENKGQSFFGLSVDGPERLRENDWDVVLLTRLENPKRDIDFLIKQGIEPDRIVTL